MNDFQNIENVRPSRTPPRGGSPVIRNNQKGTHTGAVTEYGVTDKGAHGSQKTKGSQQITAPTETGIA